MAPRIEIYGLMGIKRKYFNSAIIINYRYMTRCVLEYQGYESCGHKILCSTGFMEPCRAGIWVDGSRIKRLIYDMVLSRPEDYFSIYQSTCNHGCLKCHSHYFSQNQIGSWYTPEDVLEECLKYQEMVTVWEPRDRATMWHASDLCAHCGSCILLGRRGKYCPGRLDKSQVLLSPQGYGPARNIASFTGGDLYCNPAFYVKIFKLLDRETDLWIHIETNGFGLTRPNLEAYYSAGLDSIWLDLKAYNEDTYRSLCGTTNRWILDLPSMIHDMGIVLEIVILYIPGMVEAEDIDGFGGLISSVDRDIPVTLLAFFPEYLMKGYRSPNLGEMLEAYRILAYRHGLRRVRLGNIGVFCRSEADVDRLINEIGRSHVGL